MNTTTPNPDKTAILAALGVMFDPDDVIELRALHKSRKRTDAGYFDSAHWPAAVYVTLNPVEPQLLSRYNNRIESFASATTTDKQIVRRRWFLIDLDPVRPAQTSATDPQLEAAHAKAQAIYMHLKNIGWADPQVARSGNGYHLLYAIDLPNDDDSTALLKGALMALADRFDDTQIKVDRSVFNAARICKLYGTPTNKGDHTPSAPWRLSALVNTPTRELVTVDQLRKVQPIPTAAPKAPTRRPQQSTFNLEDFLSRHGLDYSTDQHDGRERFKLKTCPFNSEHVNGEAAVFRDTTGKLGFRCMHDSCNSNTWQNVRDLLDGPRQQPPPQWDYHAFEPGSGLDGAINLEVAQAAPPQVKPTGYASPPPPRPTIYPPMSEEDLAFYRDEAPLDSAEPHPLPDVPLPFNSEQALAEDFAMRAFNKLRWSPGLDWMKNHGTHWEQDALLHRYTEAKAVCRNAASVLENDKVKAKICAANTVNAVLSLARSNEGIVTPVPEWDKHPMVLNTPGDAIDLETGRSVSRKGMLFTQVTATAPTNTATPTWDKFISEVFDGDLEMVEFMQRLGGYSLTGSIREQKLFFLHGIGANGKSVFLDVLRALAGKYAHNLPSEALMTSRNEGHPTMFASLHGKRLAISSEIEESAHWAESRIKAMTGDETLTARFMQKDFFTFRVTHKHLIAGNFKPRFKGDDFAMVRRMVLVPFNQRFEGARRDNNLPDKLKAEYSGILAWFVEGARKWAASGLAIPESVSAASQNYMAENNDIDLWLSECCTQSRDATAPSGDLYRSFSRWKDRQGEHAPSNKSFSQRLERMFTKKTTMHGKFFHGLSVKFSPPENNSYAAESRGE